MTGLSAILDLIEDRAKQVKESAVILNSGGLNEKGVLAYLRGLLNHANALEGLAETAKDLNKHYAKEVAAGPP